MDIQNQIELEKLFNKNETMPRLKSEFRDPIIVDHCVESGIPLDFALDLLSQMVLHKRATVGMLVGILNRHFGTGESAFQDCADMLVKASEVNLIRWDEMARQFIMLIDVSAETHADLERYQYPLPMVIEPREVKTNRDTGYITSKASILLKNNHHDDDVCLDHINRANQVKLCINPETARMIQNEWAGIYQQGPNETNKEWSLKVRNFQKYDRTSRDVMEHLFMAGNEFHLTHRYDKRGRCYAQGYHVNTQGNDWNKAVIEFADEEIITGVELKKEIAA